MAMICIYSHMRMNMKTTQGRIMMKDSPVEELFQGLEKREVLKLEEVVIGNQTLWFITHINKEALSKLDKELARERPKKSAPKEIKYTRPGWLKKPFKLN